MTRLTGPQSLVNTVSLLGGPLLESIDVDWATDLPAGNAFFEWLADQLHGWSPKLELQNATSSNDEDEKTLEIRMYAALREMALEKDEILMSVLSSLLKLNCWMFSRLSLDSSLRGASMANDVPDSDYMPLSQLKCVPSNSSVGLMNRWTFRKQASYINNETELLKRETELLSSRLTSTSYLFQRLVYKHVSNIL